MLAIALPIDASGWMWLVACLLVGGILGVVGARPALGRANRHRKELEGRVARLEQELEKAQRTAEDALMALENENFTDPLTDLRNRRYISAIIRSDVAQVQRTYRDAGPELPRGEDLLFFMVDLDHFSRVNEFYGSAMGDKVLLEVTKALRRIVRESDAVIRWGGEEFLIVARHADRREAAEMAERIRTTVAGLALETPKGELLSWTCCVGFAAFPFQPDDLSWMGWDRVVEVTEACVGVAKATGRNAWIGIQAREGLDRSRHGARIPKELDALVGEGVLEVMSSRQDPFRKTKKIGEILG